MKKLLSVILILSLFIPALANAKTQYKEQCVDIALSYSNKNKDNITTSITDNINKEDHLLCVKDITANNLVIKTFGYFNGDAIETIAQFFDINYKSNENESLSSFINTTTVVIAFVLLIIFAFQNFSVINKYSRGNLKSNKQNIHTIICLLGGLFLLAPLPDGFAIQYFVAAAILFMSFIFSYIYFMFLCLLAFMSVQIDNSTHENMEAVFNSEAVQAEMIATSLVEQHLCDLSKREVELNKSSLESIFNTRNKFNECLISKRLSDSKGGTIFFKDYFNQMNFLNSTSVENKDLQLTRFCSQENDSTSSSEGFISLESECGSIRFIKTEYATEANIQEVNKKAREVAKSIRAETCNFSSVDKEDAFICADLSKGYADINMSGPVLYERANPISKSEYQNLIALIDSLSLRVTQERKDFYRYQISKLYGDFMDFSEFPTAVFNIMKFSKDNLEEKTFKDAYVGDSTIALSNDATADIYNKSRNFADFLDIESSESINFDKFMKDITIIDLMFISREYTTSLYYFSAIAELLEIDLDEKIEAGEATKRQKQLAIFYNAIGDYTLLVAVAGTITGYVLPLLLKIFYIMTLLTVLAVGLITLIFSPFLAFVFFNSITDKDATPGTTVFKILINYPIRAITTCFGFIFALVFSFVVPSFVVNNYYDFFTDTIDLPVVFISNLFSVLIVLVIMIWSVMKAMKISKTVNKSADKILSLETVNDSNSDRVTEMVFLIFKKPLTGGLFGKRRNLVKAQKKDGE